MSEYDCIMLNLAKRVSEEIAKEKNIPQIEAFLNFMKSQTGKMLFDQSTDMWMKEPAYLADEYRREMNLKKHKEPSD